MHVGPSSSAFSGPLRLVEIGGLDNGFEGREMPTLLSKMRAIRTCSTLNRTRRMSVRRAETEIATTLSVAENRRFR
jgi:hypothetical protein